MRSTMFKKKRNAAPPPPAIKTPVAAAPSLPPGPPPAIPTPQAHGRNVSTATATTTASTGHARETPLVSPLQMTFDFELPPPSPFSHSSKPSLESLRPKTSDGLAASSRKSNVSLAPPSLPPIPRVASRNDKAKSMVSYESGGSDSEAMSQPRKPRDDGDNVSISSKKSSKSTASRKSFKIFEMTLDELNKAPSLPSRPASSGSSIRPGTAGAAPKMEGTLFPKVDVPVLPPLRTMASSSPVTMDRSFVDSRDKAFQPAAPKIPAAQLQASSSTPDLSSTLKGTPKNFSQKSSLSPQTPTVPSPPADARPRAGSTASGRKVLQKKSSRPDLQGKRAPSNLSGTTARSKEYTSSKDDPLTPTVGTPYAETSPAFPAPQYVATRPNTAGAASTIAGISVPTHHTSSQPASRPDTAKAEKRKTKFLNPMAMFSRRKTAPNEVETQKELDAQEAALARQKDVAAAGVRNVPNDFDPRIRGKLVHDFSAANRQSVRSFTFNDAAEGLLGHQSKLQTASSPPPVPALQHDGADVRKSTFSGNSSTSGETRKSMHAPVFVEHLSDTPMGTNRMNAERAESLANRDFLQRASHVSNVSQESAVLPPFARRSQTMDPMQAAHFHDDSSKRSSNVSSVGGTTEKYRDSAMSTLSGVSPVTARNSVMPLDPVRQSLSPISPSSPSRAGFGGGQRPKSMASSHLRESTVFIDDQEELPQQMPILPRPQSSEHASEGIPSPPNRTAPPPPPVTSSFGPTIAISPAASPALSSNGSTPGEEQIANTVRLSKIPSSAPAKIVEKLASAVGHSKRGTGAPKHQASNASRFSFQMGESAAEELALEEKARKMRSGASGFSSARGGKTRSPSEGDEDEYFDEDAIDDMDEMEMQGSPNESSAVSSDRHLHPAPLATTALPAHDTARSTQSTVQPSQASAGVMNVNDARLQLVVSESDGESLSGAEEESASEGGYYDFVDYDSVSQHSRGPSISTDGRKPSVQLAQMPSPLSPRLPRDVDTKAVQPQHQRIMSDDSALTLNTSVLPTAQSGSKILHGDSSKGESKPGSSGVAEARNRFYMQPSANITPDKSLAIVTTESGRPEKRITSEAVKVESAQGFPIFADKHKSLTSSSTMSSDESKRPFSEATVGAESNSTRSSGPRTGSTGLGVSGFSDFHFSDSPESSRPVSKVFQNENRLTGDSETIPPQAGWLAQHRKRGSSPLIPSSERNSKGSSPGVGDHRHKSSLGKNLQARKSSLVEIFTAHDGTDGDDEDDMYFDGGGFEGDLQTGKQDLGVTMNEEAFDDDRFQRGQPMMNGHLPAQTGSFATSHQADTSGMNGASMASDGPYPSFAKPNPVKARQRDSQMLLEDLVLQTGPPVDPRYIPQRNPSEDAKRLGLSTKVPPLPPQPGNAEAADRNLQSYHAALAEAANKAASEGRFLRMPSVSTVGTQRSISVYSKAPDADKSADELSRYEEAMPSDTATHVERANNGLGRSDTQQTISTVDSALNQNTTYSPPQMSFDFGFDNGPLLDQDWGFDDYGAESAGDDIVAAANAEALASDDEGFYGQEFGFYAKARPNSGDGVQAFNGGYFGDDGDDGLTRNKSLHEPNLTPITERSEFSTRNSFIGAGQMVGSGSAVSMSSPALARLPVSPLMEGAGDITSFDQLKKLRMNAFGGSNGSLGSSAGSHRSATAQPQGYFSASGGSPMQYGYSSASDGSSNSAPTSAHPSRFSNGGMYESPASAGAVANSERMSFSSPLTEIATPRKGDGAAVTAESPLTARKARTSSSAAAAAQGHSRKSSGADSVTYVRENDPNSPNGQPRWVLERRRTSELGLSELVGREVVQGGWI